MRTKVRNIIFVAWVICHIGGFFLTSYGVLRESFSNVSTLSGFGEERFGEGLWGGGLTKFENTVVSFGVKIGLLPADKILTLTDRKENAVYAMTGVLLIGFSIILDFILKGLPK